MMAGLSAFNYQDTHSINFMTDKHSCRDDESGAAAAAIRSTSDAGKLGHCGARQPHPSEDHLVHEAQSGNEQAFIELVQRYKRPLERTIYRVVRNRQDTEDVVQETLLSAYRHLSGFRGNSSFYSWITRIGINNSLMLLRKRRSRPEISSYPLTSESKIFELPENPDFSPNPEQMYSIKQINDVVQEAVGGLPTHLRAVYEHCHVNGWSLSESATALGLTVAAAKSRLWRARHTLRKSLSPARQLSAIASHERKPRGG
jgi:RNA polymerase sigma-70 factor (ECF subfamily)